MRRWNVVGGAGQAEKHCCTDIFPHCGIDIQHALGDMAIFCPLMGTILQSIHWRTVSVIGTEFSHSLVLVLSTRWQIMEQIVQCRGAAVKIPITLLGPIVECIMDLKPTGSTW